MTTLHIPCISSVYGVLCVLYCCNCDAISRVTLSQDQTFLQAVNNRHCKLAGLDLTGEITEINKRDLVIDLGTHPMAWIGAYMERVWIQFEGCYTSDIVRYSEGLDLSTHTIKSCFSHCKKGNVRLSRDRCFCDHSKMTYTSCSAETCPKSTDLLCGTKTKSSGLFFPDISRPCHCYYSINNSYKETVRGNGSCMIVTYRHNEPTLYSSVHCNQKHLSICQDPHMKLFPHFVKTESPWYESLENCYNNNYSILGTQGLPYRVDVGTYWAGSFSVTSVRWGSVQSNSTIRSCTAVTVTRDGSVAFIPLPCHTYIPALCYSSSSTDVIVGTNINITSPVPVHINSTTTAGKVASPDIDVSKVHQHTGPNVSFITAIVVGSVLLLLIVSLVVIFLCVKRRRLRRGNSFTSSASEQTAKAGGTKTECSTRDITHHADTPDNIYDELNEFRRDRILSGPDIYDHIFSGETGNMYGHLNAGDYQYADNEYDHTFSGETDAAYGRLGTTRRQNVDSGYDHVIGSVSERRTSLDIIKSDDNARRSNFDDQYDDVSERENATVVPVYAKVIKRSQRKPTSNNE